MRSSAEATQASANVGGVFTLSFSSMIGALTVIENLFGDCLALEAAEFAQGEGNALG